MSVDAVELPAKSESGEVTDEDTPDFSFPDGDFYIPTMKHLNLVVHTTPPRRWWQYGTDDTTARSRGCLPYRGR